MSQSLLSKARVTALLAALALSVSPLAAQQPQGAAPDPRVLLVGDSWSEFMWLNRSMRDVFAANGHPELVERGGDTTISGSTAAQWTDPGRLQLITDELVANPSLEVVQLTLGGNDFLDGQPGGGWFVGMSAQEFAALRARILQDATTVIDHILAQNPSLHVLVSLYDYTNFEDASLLGCSGRWDDLGQPTARQINEANRDLQAAFEAAMASRPEVSVAQHLGLMQFAFGFPDEGIEPGDLMPPGDLDRPSPVASMFSVIGFPDCIHLSGDGYFAVGQSLWNQFYEGFFVGAVFSDGFEGGNTAAWSATSP